MKTSIKKIHAILFIIAIFSSVLSCKKEKEDEVEPKKEPEQPVITTKSFRYAVTISKRKATSCDTDYSGSYDLKKLNYSNEGVIIPERSFSGKTVDLPVFPSVTYLIDTILTYPSNETLDYMFQFGSTYSTACSSNMGASTSDKSMTEFVDNIKFD